MRKYRPLTDTGQNAAFAKAVGLEADKSLVEVREESVTVHGERYFAVVQLHGKGKVTYYDSNVFGPGKTPFAMPAPRVKEVVPAKGEDSTIINHVKGLLREYAL